MCNPMAAIAALTVVSTGYSLHQQGKAAKRSEAFFRSAQEEQEKQITASNSIRAQDRAQRARAERARLRAASAETGLTGISTDDILDNVDFQASQDIARIRMNKEFASTNSRFQLQSNLNNIQQPDYIGESLNAGLQLAGQYYSAKG